MTYDTILRNGSAILPGNGETRVDIAIKDGKIAALLMPDQQADAAEVIDISGKIAMPGVIDAHTHLTMGDSDDPYMTETRTAAMGGVTSILTYLFQSEPYEGLYKKDLDQVVRRSLVDVGFHFGAASDEQRKELDTYIDEYGVTSYKFFMNFRGTEGSYLGIEGLDDGLMYDFFTDLAKYPNGIVATHPENVEVIWRLRERMKASGREDLKVWNDSRIDFVESENILRALYFAKATGVRLYIPHLSCAMGLEETNRFRERYDRFYVETCAHYLTHTSESDIGALGKVNPPLRFEKDIEALWTGLKEGTIDVVGSDHVPRTKKFKEGGIWKATAGFPGLATLLPVMLSEGYHRRGLSLERISELMSFNPAKIFGIDDRKGSILVGKDADLAIIDLNLEKTVRAQDMGSFCDYSIYEGWDLKGWPVRTIVRGKTVMNNSTITAEPGWGQYLARKS